MKDFTGLRESRPRNELVSLGGVKRIASASTGRVESVGPWLSSIKSESQGGTHPGLRGLQITLGYNFRMAFSNSHHSQFHARPQEHALG